MLSVSILSPEKEIYKGSAKSINVPGSSGAFEILNNHAPIVSSLKSGVIKMVGEDGAVKQFEISSGFVEVLRNEVSLLVSGIKEL
jgi:F-type H+-transporting ATPase subunit epsilon